MMIHYAVETAEKAGMEDVVAKLTDSREKQIKFYRSEIGVIKEWDTTTLELFMTKGKKIVSMSVENPDREKIRKAIEKGEGIVRLMSPKEEYRGIGKNDRPYIENKKYDGHVDDDGGLVALANKTIDDTLSHVEEMAGIIYAGKEDVRLCSSRGIDEEDKNSWISLSVRAFASENASGHVARCSRSMDGLKKDAGSEAGKIAEMSLNPRKIERGKYDAILSHLTFANLISYMAEFSSAFYVDSGMSFLADGMGKNIGSDKVTVTDSGIHPDGIASRKFDDEGIATGETDIIRDGKLKSYLHNTSTAAKHGTSTTGNAGIIYPIPWNEVVNAGDLPLEEMVKGIKRGIYVTNVWYTRFQNYMTGEFSTIARDGAFFIEEGEIKHAVEGIRISDSMPHILKNVESLSNDVHQIYWWEVEVPVFTPEVLVKDVNITKSFM
jgi:PmbA protein